MCTVRACARACVYCQMPCKREVSQVLFSTLHGVERDSLGPQCGYWCATSQRPAPNKRRAAEVKRTTSQYLIWPLIYLATPGFPLFKEFTEHYEPLLLHTVKKSCAILEMREWKSAEHIWTSHWLERYDLMLLFFLSMVQRHPSTTCTCFHSNIARNYKFRNWVKCRNSIIS